MVEVLPLVRRAGTTSEPRPGVCRRCPTGSCHLKGRAELFGFNGNEVGNPGREAGLFAVSNWAIGESFG